MKKRLIALDIDGTLVEKNRPLSSIQIESFTEWMQEGAILLFISGRGTKWMRRFLAPLKGNYFFASYNGALLFSSSDEKPIYQETVSEDIIEMGYQFSQHYPMTMALYPVDETRPVVCHLFKGGANQAYLEARAAAFSENWTIIDHPYKPSAEVVSLKWIAPYNEMAPFQKKLQKELDLQLPIIRDPYDVNFAVIQGTAMQASKALPLKFFREGHKEIFCIAAGDDRNDIPMLEESDVALVLDSAPDDVRGIADQFFSKEGESNLISLIKRLL